MVYGVGPDDAPGSGMLRQMHELRALVPCISSTGKPAAKTEATASKT